MVKRMTGYEEKACRCGEDSERLSQLSYGEPPVASSSGPSFLSEGSPQPIPVPPPAIDRADPELPVSPSSPGDSDKENSNEGSFESAQQVVTELVDVTNWHFSRSFRLIFLNTYEHYSSDFILSSPHSF